VHADVQRLVSIVKMVTMLDEYTVKDHHSVVHV
jgi:hypothetical protein